MRTYWLVVFWIALVDAAIITWLLMRDGGSEKLVWWAFLLVPLFVAALIALGLALHLIRKLL